MSRNVNVGIFVNSFISRGRIRSRGNADVKARGKRDREKKEREKGNKRKRLSRFPE